MTPVGPRCPDHATTGKPTRRAPAHVRAERRVTLAVRSDEPIVTWTIIGANILVYLITVAQGFGINSPGGKLFNNWDLYGPAVAAGDWWRLITAAFLHANIVHIGLNMLGLAWLGRTLRLNRWLVPVVLWSPWFWFYGRLLWDNTFAIPIEFKTSAGAHRPRYWPDG